MTIRSTPAIERLPVRLDGRSVVHVRAEHAGERDEWEVHLDQDEFLYLGHGTTNIVLRDELDDASTERVIELRFGEACIVPRGAWHRQVMKEPSLLLSLSPECVHRPYTPTDGWTEDTSA
jgi:mannose-6-phosphate isomerase-like protein (cupin superfamily)